MARIPATALLLAAALLVAAGGCGYRLQGTGKERFSDPAIRMDVSPFANASVVPDAGPYVAARLREELRRGGFRGTFERAGADFLVEGRVREVREDVSSQGTDRFALENRLTLVLDVRVVEAVKGRVIWKEAGLSETASFFSGTDAQYTEANRRAAFEETVHRLVLRVAQTLRVLL